MYTYIHVNNVCTAITILLDTGYLVYTMLTQHFLGDIQGDMSNISLQVIQEINNASTIK